MILLSRFKHDVLLMTVNFVDLMLIDADTFSFLMQIFPNLNIKTAGAALLVLLGLAGVWRLDRFRLRRRTAILGAAACIAAVAGLAVAVPSDPWAEFYAENYFSKYMRSGVTAVSDLLTRGILESDKTVTDRLAAGTDKPCAVEKPPHIIMVHDEFELRHPRHPRRESPRGLRRALQIGDGKSRTLIVEGAGGPSWYTEYNVLTGLSARSFGRFADFVTRVAAGRVERGLPHTLNGCGYKTFTLYPMYGSFMSARAFQTSAGIGNFLDSKALGAAFLDPDAFYYNAAADRIAAHGNALPAVHAGLHGTKPLPLGFSLPARSRARVEGSGQPRRCR